MKTLFCLLALVALNQECGNQNQTLGTESPQEAVEIRYEATTRGFYEMIWISNGNLSLTNDRNHETKATYAIADKDRDELTGLLSKVDVEALPSLEAPTSKRHHDGAAFATLTVVRDGIETQTDNFDHGHPPKAIEELVSKILSLAEGNKK